jgi:hypothetical protein
MSAAASCYAARVHRSLVAFLVCGAACSSKGDTADGPTGLDCTAGNCLVPPQLQVTNQGGTALANMEVWTVVWTGDEGVGAQVDAFNKAFLASAYYTDSLAEYGVGAGVAKGVIDLGPPPRSVSDSSYDDFVQSLVGLTSSTGETFDAPNEQTVVGFVLPKSTAEKVGTSYHTETGVKLLSNTGSAIFVPYMVLEQIHVGFVSDFDYLTWSQSHELGDTATDPLPDFDPAWFNVDVLIEGEIADLCNNIPAEVKLGATTYALNRFYSQKLAAARQGDPCVPATGTPFVDVGVSPLNLHIPKGLGQSGTVRLSAYTLGPTDQIFWQVYADSSYGISPDHGFMAPGQSVTVRLTRKGTSPPDPTALDVWITDSSDPQAAIPIAESYGAVTAGP